MGPTEVREYKFQQTPLLTRRPSREQVCRSVCQLHQHDSFSDVALYCLLVLGNRVHEPVLFITPLAHPAFQHTNHHPGAAIRMTKEMPHVTVVGDLILDRYLIGDATKLNPEQPGVVICVDKEEDRLGGVAAVAMLTAGFGARVTLTDVVGRDEPGQRLLRLLDAHRIEPHVWIDDRPTTWKQRIVARGQLRPDRCDLEVTTPVDKYPERFLSSVPLGDILLISDYGKGVLTQGLLSHLVGRARNADVPALVDPARSRSWNDYGQVTLIKANWAEATEAAGVVRSRATENALHSTMI